MSPANNPIVIIPMENFRWKPRVRFMESFPTLMAALSYAFQHDCNLIVENNEGGIALFDVMQDPNGSCTAGLDLELMRSEDVLVEPASGGWSALMLKTLWALGKRLAAFLATFYTRQVVPFSQRAAIVAKKHLRQAGPFSRRAAIVANTYLRQAVPLSRRAAIITNMYLRQVVPFSRRTVIIPHTYRRQAVPFSRRAVIVANMYLRQVVPLSRRAATVANTYLRQVVQLSRRAAIIANTYLHQAVSFSRRAANFASLYAREIAPFLRNSAVKCWSESKNATPQHNRNVVAPHPSCTSQLHLPQTPQFQRLPQPDNQFKSRACEDPRYPTPLANGARWERSA